MAKKNFRNTAIIFLIVIAVILGVKIFSQHGAPTLAIATNPALQTSCDAQCVKNIQAILDEYRKKNNIPGMQMTISFAKQPMQIFSSGAVSKNSTIPVTKNTLFEIASTTKSYTAAIILQLVDEGKIKFTDTVGKWFPNEYPAWHDITVDNLLHMTSPAFDYFDYDGGIFKQAYEDNPHHLWTTKELNDFAYQHGPFCSRTITKLNTPFCPEKPGKGWAYSNTNYILLTRIAEKASGEKLKDLMYKRLFIPLGLTKTIYNPEVNPATVKNMSHAYCNDPQSKFYNQDVTNFSLSAAQGAGAIITTTEDLAKWIRALFSGKVLQTKQFAAMTKTICVIDAQDCKAGEFLPAKSMANSYGYAIFKSFASSNKNAIWWHPGGAMGQGALFMYDQTHDVVITIAQNMVPQGNMMNLASAVENYLFSPEQQKNKSNRS
jgi:D-alanyl-D-alanine carboxypeptidase